MKRFPLYLVVFALLCMASYLWSGTASAEGTIPKTVPPIIQEGVPPDGWREGTVPWSTDGTFQLPQHDPYGDDYKVTYVVHIQGEANELQSWEQVFDLLMGGAVNATIWRQTWANNELAIGTPPEGWCNGSTPWIMNGSFLLPLTDSCSGTATYEVDLQGNKHINQDWQQTMALTQRGTVNSSAWRIPQAEVLNYPLYLPLISTN